MLPFAWNPFDSSPVIRWSVLFILDLLGLNSSVLGHSAGERTCLHSRLEFHQRGRGPVRCGMDMRRVQFVRITLGTRRFVLSMESMPCSELREPQKTLESMLNTKIVLFPGHIQSVYYQNILKILTYLITTSDERGIDSKALLTMAVEKMSVFLSSGDVEAQERVGGLLLLLSRADQLSLVALDVGERDLAYS